MINEPTFEVIDRITFGDKQFHIILCERRDFSPQIRIKTYRIVDDEPGLSLMSMTKFRMRTAVRIANAIHKAEDLYNENVAARAEATNASVSA